VATASLRKSFDLLGSHLAEWVANNITFRGPEDEEWVADQVRLWEVLLAPAEVTLLVAKELQFEYLDGRIYICIFAGEA